MGVAQGLDDLGDKVEASRQLSLFPFFCMYCFRVMPSMSSMTMYSTSEERLTS